MDNFYFGCEADDRMHAWAYNRQCNTQDDFRDFVFTNPLRFWGEANPDFCKGTAVEQEAAAVLATAASKKYTV